MLPNTEKRIPMQLRLREPIHAKVKEIAKRENRALNSQIEYFCMVGIAAYEKQHGKIENKED